MSSSKPMMACWWQWTCAMALRCGRRRRSPGRGPPAALAEQLGKRDGLPRPAGGRRRSPRSSAGVGAEHRRAAGLEHRPRAVRPAGAGRKRGDGAPQHPAGHAELAGGYPGQPAAHRLGSAPITVKPASFQDGDGGLAHVGVEVVGEGVGPQDDRRPGPARPAARVPAGERAARANRGQLAVGVDAAGQLEQPAQSGRPARPRSPLPGSRAAASRASSGSQPIE